MITKIELTKKLLKNWAKDQIEDFRSWAREIVTENPSMSLKDQTSKLLVNDSPEIALCQQLIQEARRGSIFEWTKDVSFGGEPPIWIAPFKGEYKLYVMGEGNKWLSGIQDEAGEPVLHSDSCTSREIAEMKLPSMVEQFDKDYPNE